MKTAVINIKTEPSLKRRTELFAKRTGMSVSDIVTLALRQVLSEGRIVIEESLTPNPKTAKILAKALRDIKKGKNLSPIFRSSKDMDSYLSKI